MSALTWILIFYVAVTVAVGSRLVFIRNRVSKRLGVELPPMRFSSLVIDSAGWPLFVIWYGLRSFVEEMKDE